MGAIVQLLRSKYNYTLTHEEVTGQLFGSSSYSSAWPGGNSDRDKYRFVGSTFPLDYTVDCTWKERVYCPVVKRSFESAFYLVTGRNFQEGD